MSQSLHEKWISDVKERIRLIMTQLARSELVVVQYHQWSFMPALRGSIYFESKDEAYFVYYIWYRFQIHPLTNANDIE